MKNWIKGKKTACIVEIVLLSLLVIGVSTTSLFEHTNYDYITELIIIISLPSLISHTIVLFFRKYNFLKWFKITFFWLSVPAFLIILGGSTRGSSNLFEGLANTFFYILSLIYLIFTVFKFRE